jgi:hypothetical protein
MGSHIPSSALSVAGQINIPAKTAIEIMRVIILMMNFIYRSSYKYSDYFSKVSYFCGVDVKKLNAT